MHSFFRTVLVAGALTLLAPASQAQEIFTAILSGTAESPPNASPGTGFATVTLNQVLHSMRVQISFTGLLGTTTASHIHSPTLVPGGTAGVATTTPTFFLFPLGVTTGTYDSTLNMLDASSYNPAFVTANGGTTASAEIALFNGIRSGQAYVNIHTSVVGSGEIRGFLTPAAPEPGSLALLGGAALMGASHHRGAAAARFLEDSLPRDSEASRGRGTAIARLETT